MERIKRLIEKIQAQVEQQVPLSQLLVTVQMLQNEITGSMRETEVLGTSGVSVFVPNVKPPEPEEAFFSEKEALGGKQYFELISNESDDEEEPLPGSRPYIPSYEELMRLQEEAGVGDLVTGREESSHSVAAGGGVDKRITDLRKDISPGDRIIFVRELFRGDEIMFERSIRTINNFTSLQDAEHWIRRELRTKNGWRQGDPTVAQFEKLIRQRFA